MLVTGTRTPLVIHHRLARVRPGDESPSGTSLPLCPRDARCLLLNAIFLHSWFPSWLYSLAGLTNTPREGMDALPRLHIDRTVLWRGCSRGVHDLPSRTPLPLPCPRVRLPWRSMRVHLPRSPPFVFTDRGRCRFLRF